MKKEVSAGLWYSGYTIYILFIETKCLIMYGLQMFWFHWMFDFKYLLLSVWTFTFLMFSLIFFRSSSSDERSRAAGGDQQAGEGESAQRGAERKRWTPQKGNSKRRRPSRAHVDTLYQLAQKEIQLNTVLSYFSGAHFQNRGAGGEWEDEVGSQRKGRKRGGRD